MPHECPPASRSERVAVGTDIQPSEGPFYYPSASAQSAAMSGVALRKKRDDVSATQTLPDRLSVITAVT